MGTAKTRETIRDRFAGPWRIAVAARSGNKHRRRASRIAEGKTVLAFGDVQTAAEEPGGGGGDLAFESSTIMPPRIAIRVVGSAVVAS